jgi:peptidoglycan/xylan/chitin deacetylase (PgdA/CDA1 family)
MGRNLMTRRTRQVLLGLSAVRVLVLAAATSAAGRTSGTSAPGRWLAVGSAGAAGSDKAAKVSRTVMRGTTTTVPVSQPRAVLVPRSTPYQRTGSSAIALTFDDGPDPRWTPQTLAILRKYHVKATFCLIGSNVKKHPALVKKIVADGHALCNHTMHHDEHLRDKSQATILADMRQTSALITKASGGIKPRYFRAPGGNWSPKVVADARSLGMASLGWQVDPRDWAKPPASTIVARVRAGAKPGSIILMHDGGGDRSRSVAALKILVPVLKQKHRIIRL